MAKRKLKKGVVKILLKEIRNINKKDKDEKDGDINNTRFVVCGVDSSQDTRTMSYKKNSIADERDSMLFDKSKISSPEVKTLEVETEEIKELKQDLIIESTDIISVETETNEKVNREVQKIVDVALDLMLESCIEEDENNNESSVENNYSISIEEDANILEEVENSNIIDEVEDNDIVDNVLDLNEFDIKLRRKRFINKSNEKRKLLNYNIRTIEFKKKQFKPNIDVEKISSSVKQIILSDTAKKTFKISAIACSSMVGLNLIDKINSDIVLAIDSQEISWSMNKGLDKNSYQYEIFRDGKRAAITRDSKFIESLKVDTKAPNKVNMVRLNKDKNTYRFTWKEPKDNGVDVNYKVKATNRGIGASYESEDICKTIISGVEKYIVDIDGKKYESSTPYFEVNINSLKCGSHTFSVSAVDYAGNISKSKKIDFKLDNTKFFIEDYKIATNNEELTNELYDFYLVKEYEVKKDGKMSIEERKTKIQLGDYISTYFVNNNIPNISNPRYLYEDGLINVTWEENKFGTNNTEFYIECKSKKGIKSYKSGKMSYTSGDFLPGYYYQVTTDPLYKIKKNDSYTMDNNVNLDYNRFDKTKLYYFHVASANEHGNLSKTKTLELDLTNFTTINQKKDAVREILYRTKGLESDAFRKITDDIYNSFTLSTIEKLKESETKIVVMQEDITNYVLSNHNTKVTNKNICYIKEDKTIVYNTKTSLNLLIKEIVKVLDDIKENPISKDNDYLEVYNKEKTTLKDGKLSEQEYLAEAVSIYLEDAPMLRSNSPETCEFIKEKYKVIMFS